MSFQMECKIVGFVTHDFFYIKLQRPWMRFSLCRSNKQ